MENSFKRFLSLALAIVMVLSNVPVQAFATDGIVSECTEHQYNINYNTATCTEPGVTYQECIVCHATTEQIAVSALGHDFGENAATCACGEPNPNYVAPVSEEPEHVHAWGEPVVVEATCDAAGSSTRTCSAEGCDVGIETTTIDALGHDYVEGICSRCQAEEPQPEVQPESSKGPLMTSTGPKTEETETPDQGDDTQNSDAGIEEIAEESDGVIDTEAELQAALNKGGEVKLGDDIEVTDPIKIDVGVKVVLNLNGFDIIGGWNGTSTTNHIYVIKNYGDLTIEDDTASTDEDGEYVSGEIISRGIYNYGKLTLDGGIIAACDGNGGYAVNNEFGSTFVMNGGVVATTYEDDYQSSSGGFDATPLDIPDGCTATLNGGKITCVCDFTFAVASSGDLNIPADSTIEIIGTHGAIAVQGGTTTINAGTFKIPADEYRRTDNVIYVSGGKLTINGGTFTGDSDTASGGSCVCDTIGTTTINGGTFSGSSSGDVCGTTGTTIKGGTFENLIETQHIAPGYELGADGKVAEKSYPVEVDGKGYETLAEAIEIGGEVKVLSDIVLTEGLTIARDNTVILNLNGHTISQSKECTASYEMINNLGKLTITGNGKLSFTDTGAGDPNFGWGSYTIRNEGTLVVENGTIEHLGEQASHCIQAIFQYAGSTTIKGGTISTPNYRSIRLWHGTMTIDGGEMVGRIWVQPMGGEAATLTINGGTITPEQGDANAVYVSGGNTVNMTINGGTFNGAIADANNQLNAAITNGTFSNDVSKYVADGFKCVQSTDGTYGIAEKDPVAQIVGGEKYKSLQEAVNAAENGQTITLLDNIKQADGVLISSKNLTINLNGKTFTVTEGANTSNRNIKITGTSVVTVKNGTLIAEGEMTSGAYGTIRTEGTAVANLTGLKLYSYRGNGLNVKACTGTTINIENTEIYAEYSGGVEAAGGTIDLKNVKIKQTGVYSGAAWCSVAIGVNGGGMVTVNSGDYSAAAIASDANAAQGTWVAYVMSSGGTLEINGGTFNGTVAETAAAANACGIICADTKAIVNINGGTFNSNGAILDMRNNTGGTPNPEATLKGGTFSADPTVSGLYASNLIKVAEGYTVKKETGKYVVVEMPNVAQIGTTTYKSLQKAVEVGGEIKLLADVTETIEIPENANIVLDLNGKTVNGYFAPFKGNVTVKNGSIVNNSFAASALEINAGTLNLENVNVQSGRHAIRIDGAVNATIKGGKYELLIVEKNKTQNVVNISGTAKVTIVDGTFIGPKGTAANSGAAVILKTGTEVTIEGGNFSGGKLKTLDVGGTLTITGGTFDQKPADKYVAAGYESVKVEGGYKVRKAATGALGKSYIEQKAGRTRVYGEIIPVYANESIEIKLYSGETLVATTSLNNQKYTFPYEADELTMNLVFAGELSSSWNTVTEEGHPVAHMVPDKAVLYLDGKEMNTAEVTLNRPDNIGTPYVWGALPGVKKSPAMIGDYGYATLQAAINAAQNGDTVQISAGEYAPINISNKNITLAGTVGDNGELLTTIKGGNTAIEGSKFNGTIKDIKIVDTFKVMYAEPAGNVTVDNVYVTGATYGFHLVAYSKDLSWTIQNSYMDLAWANSFGVHGGGDAAITIKGNTFESTRPYYSDYGALHVNSYLPNVTVEENNFGKNAKIYIDKSVTDTSKVKIEANYHADGPENAFADDEDAAAVELVSYYQNIDANGNRENLVVIPRGTITPAYTSETTIWGEATGNASKSFAVKLYSDETLLVTATLNDPNGAFIDGNIENITWSIPVNNAGNDSWWTVEWENYITADVQPTKVVAVVDGVEVAENTYKLNSPDDLSKIVAAVVDADGKIVSYHASLTKAVEKVADGGIVTLLCDVEQADGIIINKDLTIDLNKHTFTVTEGNNTNNRNIKVTGAADVTIKNGTMIAEGAKVDNANYGAASGTGCYGTVRFESTGKLAMTDVNLENYRPWGLNIKLTSGTAELTNVNITSEWGGGIEVAGAKATLTDCSVEQTHKYDHCSTAVSVSGGGSVTVNGGTYKTENYCANVMSSGGTITINDGNFTATEFVLNADAYGAGVNSNIVVKGGEFAGNYRVNYLDNGMATISITGGTFDHDPTAYMHEDYEAIKNETAGTWTVQHNLAKFQAYIEVKGEKVYYQTLAEAVAAAPYEGTVHLTKDITLTAAIETSSRVKINGHNFTITSTAKDAFRVNANTTFTNLTIVNNTKDGRCINTRTDGIIVTLTNVNLTAVNGNSQPLTVGGTDTDTSKRTEIRMQYTNIDAGNAGYGVIAFVPAKITHEGHGDEIKGYAAFYMKKGSDGSQIVVNNDAIVTGTNAHSGSTNNFGTFVFETVGNTVNILNGAKLNAAGSGAARQALFSFLGEGTAANKVYLSNGNINLAAADTILFCGSNITNLEIYAQDADIAQQFVDAGYTVNSSMVEPPYLVHHTAWAINDDPTQYGNIKEAYARAKSGDTLILMADANNNPIEIKNKVLTFDLNGHTWSQTAASNANGTAPHMKGNNAGMIVTSNDITIKDSVGTGKMISSVGNLILQKGSNASVTLNGGTYEVDKYAHKNYASLDAYIVASLVNTANTTDNVINVSGGKFTSNGMPFELGYMVNKSVDAIAIEEAWFNNDMSDWIEKKNADGNYYAQEAKDGMYHIGTGIVVATVNNGTAYTTLTEAVAKAPAGATVTLVKDATGAGAVIDKNITIDLGGKTYTFNKCVGSAGTETLGLQILKGNDVTIKNGTLAATTVTAGLPVKVLIQNYANLTLNDVTLDGTGSTAMLYVLSNNSGTININGATNITAPAGACAFDVYDYSAAGYTVPSVNVNTTGMITGKIEVSDTATLAISGGTFTVPVEETWCAEGFIPAVNTDGTYTVKSGAYTVRNTTTGVGYETLKDAVDAATADDTITLLVDIEDADVTINKAVTLDLGGKTITDAYIKVTAKATIQNGSIKNVDEPYPLVVQNGGELTIKAVAIEASKSDRAIWVRSGSTLNFESGSILATKGANNNKTNLITAIYTDTNTNVNINGGTITVDTPDNKAVGIFGNYSNANVTVTGGKISTSGKNYSYGINVDGDITVSGGEIVTNEKGYGYSSGIRYGNNYALVSATGDVTISGGKITTNGYSGYIVNVGRTYSSNDQTVTITGGDLSNNLTEVEMTTGGHKAPVLIWEGSASKVTATISNGTVKGFNETMLRGANTTLAISGGTFDKEVKEEYCADGFIPTAVDGSYTVKLGEYLFRDEDGKGYETLQEAIDGADASVTMIKNASGAGAVIDKDITLDLNSFTYTFNKCVGSAGTETLGLQILKDNNVTIKSGTLEATTVTEGKAVKVLIQNYANLTLTDVTLNGTGSAEMQYVLSNNSGTININGATNITAPTTACAFDVYDYSAAGYAVPIVNVNTTGKITGAIEVSDSISSNLNISGGTFTVPVKESWCAEGYIPNANSDGTYGVKAGYYVAHIGEQGYETLEAAFAAAQNGDEVEINKADTYALSTSGKDITITGTVDGVVFDNIGANNLGGANVTFNNVTFDYYPNVNYTGLQHSGNLVYNNCTINGQVFLYGVSETFNNCIFNQNSADAYNVWTYGAKEVKFNECEFNSAGKSILIYSDQAGQTNDVTVTGCTITASETVDTKAAIEMDSSIMTAENSIKLTISNTTATGFSENTVSGSSLWNNKKGCEGVNNDMTVTVDGDVVLEPIHTAQIGDLYYTSLSSAVEAAQDKQTVVLVDNTTGAGVVINKDVTIDLNGKTYTFNEGVGSSGTPSNGLQILQGNTVIVKNGTLNVDASANANFYILIQNYADLTLEDVTLDGTNLDKWSGTDGDSYVLSNNSGTVNITGATNITANDEGDKAFAFDVCKYGSYEAPIVNVNTTGTITGAIEVSKEIPSNLNISGGTFTVPVAETWCADGYIPADNGDGTYGVKQGAYVARVNGGQGYETIDEAFAVVKSGDTITLLADCQMTQEFKAVNMKLTIDGTGTLDVNDQLKVYGETELDISCPMTSNQVILGNDAILKDSTISGKVFLYGKATFRGNNTVALIEDFGTHRGYGQEADQQWIVEEGASLSMTSTARYGLGYGDKVTINGKLADATTARDTLTDADRSAYLYGGISMMDDWDVKNNLTVNDAYVVIGVNSSFGTKDSYGNKGDFIVDFNNSVLDSSRVTVVPGGGEAFFTFTDSDVKTSVWSFNQATSTAVFENTYMLATGSGTDYPNINAGTMTMKESEIKFATGKFTNNGTINMDADSLLTASKIDGTGKIIIDATGYTGAPKLVVAAGQIDCGVQVIGAAYEITAEGIVIEKAVASNGDNYYTTLQAAINDCVVGENTIKLLDAISDDVTISQTEGVNIVIDGNQQIFSGTMNIHGNSRNTGAETLTIKNVKFETDEASHNFIWSKNGKDNVIRYAHNVTVQDSTFTATGAAKNTAVGLQLTQVYNFKVERVESNGLHSLMQADSSTGIAFNAVTVTGKNGISVSTSLGVSLTDSTIAATGEGSYGLRTDADTAVATTLVVENNNINAFIPVLVRNATTDKAYDITIKGNTLNGSNVYADDAAAYSVVISKGDVDDAKAPVQPTANFTVTTDVPAEKVFPFYVAQIGENKYLTLQEAIAAVEAAQGGTIDLLADVELDTKLLIGSNSSGTKYEVTLNGNGHTIKADDDFTKGDNEFLVDITWNVTLNDVTFDANNNPAIRGVQFYTSESTLKNVTVKNVKIDKWGMTDYAIHVNASDLTVTGNLNFENCKHSHLVVGYGSNLTAGTDSTIDTTAATLTDVNIVLADAKAAQDNGGVVSATVSEGTPVGNSVAKIGNTYYGTFQSAVNEARNDETVTLVTATSENITIEQVEGKNITIDGGTVEYSGTIYIDGNSRDTGSETLTIQNFTFTTDKAEHDFISANSKASDVRYAHNVTVKDSTFTATGSSNDAVVGMRFRQAYNIKVDNVTATNMHSLMWATGVTNLEIDEAKVENCLNGISVGTSKNVTVKNSDIKTTAANGYGIRADGSVVAGLTVESNDIEAFIPVLVRNASAEYTLTIQGDNSVKHTNTDGYNVVISTADYTNNGTMTQPTGNVKVNHVDGCGVLPATIYPIVANIVSNSDVTTHYVTAQAAIDAAVDGDQVNIWKDVTEDLIVEKSITIDLSQTTLNGQIKFLSGTSTVQNGTVTGAKDLIVVGEKDQTENTGINVTLDKTLTVKSTTDCALLVYDGNVTSNGTLISESKAYAAVQSSGNDYGNVVINGTVEAADVGIYWPGKGDLTINAGATVTGATGIYVKQGNVELNAGATITGNGAKAAHTANGDGGNSTGDAITVDAHGAGFDAPVVTINGATLVSTNSNLVGIYGGTVKVTSGDYTADRDAFRIEGGNLDIAEGVKVTAAECAIFTKGGDVTTAGDLTSTGAYAAIQGNGNADSAGNVTITGGSVTNNNSIAIYWPQNGELTVSGGVITGTTGIYVKDGTISITGGEIKATGTKNAYVVNGNGANSTGDALVIDTCSSTDHLNVSVTGGTFTSANGEAVASYAENGYTAASSFLSVKDANTVGSTGATVNTLPAEELLAKDCYARKNDDSTWIITQAAENAVAVSLSVNTYYTDIDTAMACGKDVMLLVDCETTYGVVETGTVLDLNGHTLTAKILVSFGDIIDGEAGGEGKLKVSRRLILDDDSNANFMPIKAADGSYKFYKYELMNLGGKRSGTNGVMFGFRLVFENIEGYNALKTTDGIKLITDITWDGMASDRIFRYVFNENLILKYCNQVYEQVSNGKPITKAMAVTITGLNKLVSGSNVSAAMIMSNEAVEYEVTTVYENYTVS